jgi:uncharacterized membrane protein
MNTHAKLSNSSLRRGIKLWGVEYPWAVLTPFATPVIAAAILLVMRIQGYRVFASAFVAGMVLIPLTLFALNALILLWIVSRQLRKRKAISSPVQNSRREPQP